MLTGEMLHMAFVRAVSGYEVRWANLDDPYKALFTAMAAHANTALIDNGAAERAALRSHLSQVQAHVDELIETLLRVEAERDAFQQLAGAKGDNDA